MLKQIPQQIIKWNESSVHDHFQTPVHAMRNRDRRRFVKNYVYVMGQLPCNKEELQLMDPTFTGPLEDRAFLSEYIQREWIDIMTDQQQDMIKQQLIDEERISFNWWLISSNELNRPHSIIAEEIKKGLACIVQHYEGRLLDSTLWHRMQSLLPFSAYFRHYRVKEFRSTTMDRVLPIISNDKSVEPIQLIFYDLIENKNNCSLNYPGIQFNIMEKIDLQQIDWFQVLNTTFKVDLNDKPHLWIGRPLLCITDTVSSIGRLWFYQIIQRLQTAQQCLLVSLQSTSNDNEDIPFKYGLWLALTSTIGCFYGITDTYQQVLKNINTTPNQHDVSDSNELTFEPAIMEYWWGECTMADSSRVHRWLQSKYSHFNSTIKGIQHQSSTCLLDQEPLQQLKRDKALSYIKHRQQWIINEEKRKNEMELKKKQLPLNSNEAIEQLFHLYYITFYQLDKEEEEKSMTITSFINELSHKRELFISKEWPIEQLYEWANSLIMTVEALTNRLNKITAALKQRKKGKETVTEDDLSWIDIKEKDYFELATQRSTSFGWLKLIGVELQIVLLLETAWLRQKTLIRIQDVETTDQQQMQLWADKLCIWASFIDHTPIARSNLLPSTMYNSSHKTNPLEVFYDGLLPIYKQQLPLLLDILYHPLVNSPQPSTIRAVLGKRSRNTRRSNQSPDIESLLLSEKKSTQRSIRRRRRHDPDCIPARHGVNNGKFPFHHRQVYLDPKVVQAKLEKRQQIRSRRHSSASSVSTTSSTPSIPSFLSKRSNVSIPTNTSNDSGSSNSGGVERESIGYSITGTPCSNRIRNCLVPESPLSMRYTDDIGPSESRPGPTRHHSANTVDELRTPSRQRRAPWLLSKTPQGRKTLTNHKDINNDEDDLILQQLMGSPSTHRTHHYPSIQQQQQHDLIIQETPVKRSGRLLDLFAAHTKRDNDNHHSITSQPP
ncbi:hypothetical protein BDF19DRAFT_411672 [Syncephalis fuscata]|nr:hypothetical protein BDF19DRAFT_411672 [Syncephalis fuscata]